MTTRALTIHDIGRELGRTADWVSRNWDKLVREGKLPPPLLEGGPPTWDAAQVYAVRDRKLTPQQRVFAAAFRAAQDAAATAPAERLHENEIARDRERLDRRFSGKGADAPSASEGVGIRSAQRERA